MVSQCFLLFLHLSGTFLNSLFDKSIGFFSDAALNPVNKREIFAVGSKTLVRIDNQHGRFLIKMRNLCDEELYVLTISHNGKFVLVGGAKGLVRAFDSELRIIWQVGASARVKSLFVYQDRVFVATDMAAKSLSLNSGLELGQYQMPSSKKIQAAGLTTCKLRY
jgi:hypothetical protein